MADPDLTNSSHRANTACHLKPCRCGSTDIAPSRARRQDWICRACDVRRANRDGPAHRARSRLRLRRLAGAPGGPYDYARPDYQQRIAYYGGLCAYCRQAPHATLDHGLPVSRGGGNWAANIYPACKACNAAKYNKLLTFDPNDPRPATLVWLPPRLRKA